MKNSKLEKKNAEAHACLVVQNRNFNMVDTEQAFLVSAVPTTLDHPKADEQQRGMHCIVQHFVTYLDQVRREVVADFAQPCVTCAQLASCDLNWMKHTAPFLEETGLSSYRPCRKPL